MSARGPGPARWRAGRRALAVLLLAACGSPAERFSDRVERAEQLAAENDPQAAILEYQNALALEPESAEVYERIADLYRAQSRFADALGYYREAFRLDPTRTSAAMNEARLLVFSDAKRARELVDRGLADAPELSLVHVTASQLALAQGNTRRALEAATRAVELGPEDVAAWVQLGAVHQARIRESQQRGKRPAREIFASALAAFERVDQLAHGHPRAQAERARTLGVWGRHDEAVAGYQAAIDLAMSRGNLLDAAAAAEAFDDYARERHDNELRRVALRRLVAAKPDDYPAWDRLARLVGGQRGHSEDEVYRKLLELRPEDPQAHVLFVAHLQREERDEEAVAHLQATLDAGFDDPVLWDQLLRVRIAQGRYVEARSVLERMREEYPDDRTTRVAEARLATAEGRYDDAIATLGPLVEKEAEFEPLRLLALAYHRRGDGREARAAMDRALALSPVPPLAALRLDAQIDYATGDYLGVIQALQIVAGRGEELTPEERVLGATALYQTGRPRVGRAQLEEILAAPDAPPEAALEFARFEKPGDPVRAHQVLVAAWTRRPRAPALLEALTRLEAEHGETAAALARLDTIVAEGRATPRTLLLRAELHYGTQSFDKAEADVLRAFEANPELPGAADLLFAVYEAQGRLAEARRSFEQAEAAGVLHSGARALLARLLLAEGDTARARELFEQVLRDNPRMIEARRDLALVLALRGEELERALELAREAEARSESRPDTVDAVGFVHLKAGRHEAALTSFRRAIRLAAGRSDARSATYLYHVGLALRAQGRDQQAIGAFRQALGRGHFPEQEAAQQVVARTPAS